MRSNEEIKNDLDVLKRAMISLDLAENEVEKSTKLIESLLTSGYTSELVNHEIYRYRSKIRKLRIAVQKIEAQVIHEYMNSFLEKVNKLNGFDTYESKKVLASQINRALKPFGCAIYNDAANACLIYALPSRNGKGRFTLEEISTKKRSGSFENLSEMLPLFIMSIAIIDTDIQSIIEKKFSQNIQNSSNDSN